VNLIIRWYDGWFVDHGTQEDVDALIGAFRAFGLELPSTQLYRVCWLSHRDVESLSQGDDVRVKAAPKTVQSWTDSVTSAKHFASHGDFKGPEDQYGDPEAGKAWSAAVVGAMVPSSDILSTTLALRDAAEPVLEEVRSELSSHPAQEGAEFMGLRELAIQLMSLMSSCQVFMGEREWTLALEEPLGVNHLEVGKQLFSTKANPRIPSSQWDEENKRLVPPEKYDWDKRKSTQASIFSKKLLKSPRPGRTLVS
jgi:hypothetical protein